MYIIILTKSHLLFLLTTQCPALRANIAWLTDVRRMYTTGTQLPRPKGHD